MTITLQGVRDLPGPLEIVVHSVEGALYSVRAIIDDKEVRVVGDDGKTLCGSSVAQVRERLEGVNLGSITLRQELAYDEMVGQPPREDANTLEVQVANPHE